MAEKVSYVVPPESYTAPPRFDLVNHPLHYTEGDVECIDAIKASMGGREYAGFLKGQVMKYLWRYEKKADPAQDLRKAEWYLDTLIGYLDENPQLYAPKHWDAPLKINVS